MAECKSSKSPFNDQLGPWPTVYDPTPPSRIVQHGVLVSLPARSCQRIEHVGLDAEQTQLKDLEQASRSGADDQHFYA